VLSLSCETYKRLFGYLTQEPHYTLKSPTLYLMGIGFTGCHSGAWASSGESAESPESPETFYYSSALAACSLCMSAFITCSCWASNCLKRADLLHTVITGITGHQHQVRRVMKHHQRSSPSCPLRLINVLCAAVHQPSRDFDYSYRSSIPAQTAQQLHWAW
jgi:hypothetical protein